MLDTMYKVKMKDQKPMNPNRKYRIFLSLGQVGFVF